LGTVVITVMLNSRSKPLLDDLHVQQAQEAAAEAEAQARQLLSGVQVRLASFSLQLLHGIAQLFILVGVHREDACPHHRLHVLEAMDVICCMGARTLVMVSPTFTSLAVLMPLMM
jgi:hypothetical protein